MTYVNGAKPRRIRASVIGCSTLALLAPSAAWAACSPNPTQSGTTTTCDGSEAAGLSVGTTGAVVLVNPAATITAPVGVAAISVTAAPPTASYATLAGTIYNNGRIDGGSASGILVTPGAPVPSYYYVYYTETAINVGTGGFVTGSNGISIVRNPASTYTVGRVTLDNNGTISGTSGVALLTSDPSIGSFAIVNAGTIGAINAAVVTLDNSGIIDGGTLSALATPATPNYYSNYTTITNGGTIRSASAADTIALRDDYSYPGVTNSGAIINSGSGAALSSTGSVGLTNSSGGSVVSAGSVAINVATSTSVSNDGTISAGTTAINAGGAVQLTNRGTILGDVRSASGADGSSNIDTSGGGTITGSVLLGSGDDRVSVDYSTGATLTGISGTVDAGSGTNTLRLVFGSDTILSAPIALPATFQQLVYGLADKTTLTLAPGFTQATTIVVGGNGSYGSAGTLVSNATLATVGPAIAQQYPDIGFLTVVNNGSINATLTRPYDAAISLGYGSGPVTNVGSITAVGGRGVNLLAGTLTNSGSITADGDAVTGFNTVLLNTGSIVSTGGTGFVGSGSGTIETNGGTISGATAGAQIGNITLINSGTITSPNTGVALDSSAILDNRAGGIINGGVGPASPYGFGYTYQVKVINAGTINGNVNFGASPYAFSQLSNNVFVASPGGVVNGDLFLGTGNDVFVTSLTNTGSGAFAGVTGTVSGTGTETIRYLVDASASAVVASAGIFSRVGYELAKGTTLTLSALAPQVLGIEFAGSGTVDLAADLSQTDASIINLTAQSALVPAYPQVPNAINLTSHGTLSATSTVSAGYYAPPAVLLGAGSIFINDGTIVLHGTGAGLVGIAGAGTVTNAGTITLDGATAIGASGYAGNPLTVINSGTISQTSGGATSTGISGATTITNSGSIIVGGAAVSLGDYGSPLVVANSGTLQSTSGAAIAGSAYSYSSATVTNAAGANIVGVGQAVVLPGGGVVDNSGSISGDVVLGCTSGYCYGGGASTYVARAGSSLIGNLTFGASDDTFISLDGTTGVTGTISGGGGVNTYARAYAASTTVAAGAGLPTGFERQGIGATGAGTVVTVTGPAAGLDQGLFFFGDGRVVNQATVNGGNEQSGVHTVSLGGPAGLPGVGSTLAFINQATLNDGVAGSVRSFTNSGTIDAPVSGGEAVNLTVPAGPFDFTNSGTIATATYCYDYGYGAPTCYADPSVAIATVYGTITGVATITNSGTLTGAIDVVVAATNLTLDNSGTITDAPSTTYATPNYVAVGLQTGINADTVTVTNRGTIANGLALDGLTRSLVVTNSGTIGNSSGSALYLGQNARQLIDATGGVMIADQDSVTLTNSGAVDGTIEIAAHATTTTVLNTGTVTKSTTTPSQGVGTIMIGARTVGSQTITVVNSGSVIDTTAAGAALAVTGFASSPTGSGPAATPMAGGPAATIAVTNSGTLRADGGGQVVPGTTDYPGDTLSPAIALKAVATSDGASQITITNAAGGIISATGAPGLASGSGPVTGGFATGGSAAVFASATTVAITNAGTISGGTGTTIAAGSTVNLPTTLADPGAYLAGAVATVGSVDTLVNARTGVITGSIDLGAFDDRIENYGTITGNVYLRDGNDTFVQSLGATLTGVADGGAGTNTLLLDATGGGALTQALLDRFVNFAAPTISGTGTITTTGPLSLPTLTVTGGTLTLAAGSTLATSGPVTITAGDADVTIVNLGTIAGGIALGGGSDRIDNRGIIGGDLALGDGADVVTNSGTIGGAVTTGNGAVSLANSGTIAGRLAVGDGPVQLVNSGLVAAIALGGGTSTVSNTGMIAGGVTGSGPVSLANGGTIAGGVVFGDGVVQLTNGGRIDRIVLGNGNDTVVNTGTVSGAVSFGNGADTLTNGGTLAGPVRFGGGATVVNSGAITGTLTFGSGLATLATSGPITGMVAFGAGDDTLTLQHGGRVSVVDGGAGNNTLILASGGNDAAPDEVVLSGVTGFGRTRVTGGVTALSGSYITGTLDIAAGRLIGRAGSTITAPTIAVAPGATFGSAGTVVGNVVVGGTLSPGASPGTMTVNGTVTLAGGSKSLFEITPAISDQLLLSGSLTIAPGASLTLTGSRPLTPGTPLDLIIASGGISGSFTTIDQASTVLGFVRQSATRLQLVGQFALDPAFSLGATGSVNYVNSLLAGGSASPALLAAVPSLLTPAGTTNGAAFALLPPEAYASASRIGTENGLTLAQALRSAADAVHTGGLFTFVQGVGAWRQLRGDANASRADVSSGGVIGGVGFDRGIVSLSAFGGYLDSRQAIGALGAHTIATGSVAGVSGTVVAGALGAVATLVYDGSDATTVRSVPAATARGDYSLHGFTADARLTYALSLGAVRLSPEAGVTHVATIRASADETGSAAFGLTVAARTDTADFIDGALRIAAADPAAFAPWASLGVRYQFDGRDRFASAHFGGGTSELIAPGVAVADTVASVGLGFNWLLGQRVMLYSAYRGEFARGETGNSATLGARLSF